MFRWPLQRSVRYFKQAWKGTLQPTTFLGAAMIGLVWAGLAFHLSKEKEGALQSAKQNSGNLARVFEEHVGRVVEQADKAILSLRALYEANPDKFDIADARIYLDNLILQISIIGPDGVLKASTTALLPGAPIDLSDRDHFRALRDDDRDNLQISPPVVGRNTGKISIQLLRRLTAPDKTFGGVIVASIDQSNLARFYGSVDVGSDGTIVVMGTDRVVRVSRGFKNMQADESYPVHFLFSKAQASPTGFFATPGQVDGISRLVSYRKVASLPLIVAVGLAEHEVLQEYERAVRRYITVAGILTLTVLIAIFVGVRRERKLIDTTSQAERAKKALARSEERYRLVEDAVNDGIWDRNLLTDEEYFSTRWKSIFGYSENELPNAAASFLNLVHPDDKPVVVEALRAHLEDKKPYALDYRVRCKNGDYRWVNSRGRALWDGGRPVRMLGIISDISERKHTEALIAESRDNLARAEKMAGLGHYKFDRTKSELTWSDGIYRILGQSHASYTPTPESVLELTHPEDRTILDQYRCDVMDGMECGSVTLRFIRRDGAIVYVENWAKALRAADGSVTGMFGTIKNITEYKNVEAALSRANQELLDKQYAIDQAVIVDVTDLHGTITYANDNFCKISGYTREELLGADHRMLNAAEHSEVFFSDMFRHIAAGQVWRGEICNKANNGALFWVDTTIVPQLGPDGKPTAYMAIRIDITARKVAEAKISYMANHDTLTGLGNRAVLNEKLAEALARLRRHHEPFSVLLMDLDGFKHVNDSLGHAVGDVLLKELAKRLSFTLRETDTLVRLGGDEFAIIQDNKENQREAATSFAIRLLDLVGEPFNLDGNNVTIGASIGIAFAPEDGVSPGELLQKADLALYRVKSEGRNNFRFFDEEMSSGATKRLQLLNDLRAALGRDEFELHYQLIFDATTQRPCGAEALIRWRHPVEGLVPPDRFIPLAEEAGLMERLGEWIIEKACADAVCWPDHIKVAVNLSAVQFRSGKLFDVILCALVDSGLSPERLELEITESVIMQNAESYRLVIQQLKNIGISIALDDFGTGYSSLSYLTKFPFDKIKIDRSFTQGLESRADCAAIIASVLTLARGLGIVVTAEGVETLQQFELLRVSGVQQVQGYLFARPSPIAQLDVSAFDRKGTAAEAA